MCHPRIPLVAALVLSLFGTPAVADRPNILVVIGDDIGWKDYGCYGHPSIRTPNIDALAKEGVLFEEAFTHAPMTLPAHATLFTSLLPSESRVLTNGQTVERELPLLPITKLPLLANDSGKSRPNGARLG